MESPARPCGKTPRGLPSRQRNPGCCPRPGDPMSMRFPADRGNNHELFRTPPETAEAAADWVLQAWQALLPIHDALGRLMPAIADLMIARTISRRRALPPSSAGPFSLKPMVCETRSGSTVFPLAWMKTPAVQGTCGKRARAQRYFLLVERGNVRMKTGETSLPGRSDGACGGNDCLRPSHPKRQKFGHPENSISARRPMFGALLF